MLPPLSPPEQVPSSTIYFVVPTGAGTRPLNMSVAVQRERRKAIGGMSGFSRPGRGSGPARRKLDWNGS
jgi:hypothetical protein